MKTVEITACDVVIVDGESRWSMSPEQLEKHSAMFGADVAKLPNAERAKLAELVEAAEKAGS